MIHFVAPDANGGRRLRSEWPAEALADRGWSIQLHNDWPKAAKSDTVLMHRPLSRDSLNQLRSYQQRGARVIVQEDDDLSCIPPLNRWQAKPEQLEAHDQAVREADAVIVTTKRLEKVYGTMAKRCHRVPNYLPSRIASTLYQYSGRPDGRVRVGWAGTVEVHQQDLEWLSPVAGEALAGAVLVTVGDPPDGRVPRAHRVLGGLDEVESHPWTDDEVHFYKLMSRADIGIVPLEPNDFNTSKSWLKALEYMTLGKPVVVTDLPEQAELVDHGVDGFLAKTPKDFARYVQLLVRDVPLREEMARAAKTKALGLSLEKRIEEWEWVLSNKGARVRA